MEQTTGHPRWERLAAFDRGQLGAAERAEMERHLAHCDACCRQLAAVPEDPFVAKVRAAAAAPGTPAPPRPAESYDLLRGVLSQPPAGPAGAEIPPELAAHP